MTTFLFSLMMRLVLQWPLIFASLEKPAINPPALKYRIGAFCCFAITGLLAIPGAIVHSIVGECEAFEILGFGAITALGFCLLCGLRYAQLNVSEDTDQSSL